MKKSISSGVSTFEKLVESNLIRARSKGGFCVGRGGQALNAGDVRAPLWPQGPGTQSDGGQGSTTPDSC